MFSLILTARIVRSTVLLTALLGGPGVVHAQFASTGIIPPVQPLVVVDGNGVSATNGSLNLSKTELSIGPAGYGLVLTRYFSLNTGWRDSLSGFLTVHRTVSFAPTSTASWGNQSWTFGYNSSLSKSGDGATLVETLLTLRDGTTVQFGQALPAAACYPTLEIPCDDYYAPTVVTYPNGVTLNIYYRIFTNPVSFRVQSVVSSAGYQIKFTYASNTMNNALDALKRVDATAINTAIEYCDPAADSCNLSSNWPHVSYSSTSDSNTVALNVTDSSGGVTRYTSTGSSYRIKSPGSSVDNFQYSLERTYNINDNEYETRVTSASINSSIWQYSYSGSSTRTVSVSDPLQQITKYTSVDETNFGWRLLTVTDPLDRTTSVSYPCAGNHNGDPYLYASVTNAVLPESNEVNSACDERGNVTSVTRKPKPGAGLANIVTTSSFASACTTSTAKVCNQPTATVDGRGSRTDFTYDAAHGGVTTQTLPAVTVCSGNGSSCTAVRPQKRYTYGQIYPYVRNATGSLVQAASPVWVLMSVSECRASASCAGSADEVVTNYEYASGAVANRVLARGKVTSTGGVARRSCMSYDAMGNVISITTPGAGLGACP